jgi:hypothetical protein
LLRLLHINRLDQYSRLDPTQNTLFESILPPSQQQARRMSEAAVVAAAEAPNQPVVQLDVGVEERGILEPAENDVLNGR